MSSAPDKPHAELCIRPSRPADEDFIASLSEVAFATYSRHAATWVEQLRSAPEAHTLVATVDEVPVGLAVIEMRRARGPFGPYAAPAVAHLDAIAVVQGYRGQGIGAHLLEVALEEAQRRGAVAVTLMTAARNRRARRLFEAMGFAVIAALDGAYAERERALMMHLALPE